MSSTIGGDRVTGHSPSNELKCDICYALTTDIRWYLYILQGDPWGFIGIPYISNARCRSSMSNYQSCNKNNWSSPRWRVQESLYPKISRPVMSSREHILHHDQYS